MLHRRQAGPTSSGPPPAGNTPDRSTNQAFKPLRRESGSLYSPPVIGPTTHKPRYSVSSASPAVNTYGNQASAGYFPPPAGPSGPGNAGHGLGYGSQPMYNGGGAGYGAQSSYGSGNTFDLTEKMSSFPGTKDEWMAIVRHGVDSVRRGSSDAARLDKSWAMAWSDVELRNLILRSTLINLVSLMLLSFSPIVLSPALSLSPDAQDKARSVGLWYNMLLSWPVFVLCFGINAYWGPAISKRAQTLLHPAYRHQPSSPAPTQKTFSSSSSSSPDPFEWVSSTLQRLLLILDFTVVSRLILLLPIIGRPLAFGYMCIINSYYFFDYTFTSRGWSLDHRIVYMQERLTYMIGFGFLATFLTSFLMPLMNMAIFALIYPFFVLQALLARPPVPRSSFLPTTPSPHLSLPASPSEPHQPSLSISNPFFNPSTPSRINVGVPIFFFARYALAGVSWVEAALGRHRSGGMRERPGKRLM